MSLRSFHLVFITVATLLFLFLTIWGNMAAETGVMITGILGLLFIPIYGFLFLKKSKHLEE